MEHNNTVQTTTFYRFVMVVFIPLMLVGVITFFTYIFTHWQEYTLDSASMFHWFVSFVALMGYLAFAYLAVKIMLLLGKGIADIYQTFTRHEMLHADKNVIVHRYAGKIIVTPVSNQLPEYQEHHLLASPTTNNAPDTLPTNVLYNDIRDKVPHNHILVGVDNNGIRTKDKAVGACVWIVGLSGTGKTSTTVLRVEERHTEGHKFLGIDPHFFKPDSLSNAVSAYANSFLQPIAQTASDMKQVLRYFLDEFNARKSGKILAPYQKITLLIDEVGSLMDTTTDDEEEIAEMLPSIARICGQEARNFNMGGIFISQQATGLSWLRKVALMIIVHQLLMESEKKLALNGDKAVMENMKFWPIGRTYVYGVGFTDGPMTVQQPYFKPDEVASKVSHDDATVIETTLQPTLHDVATEQLYTTDSIATDDTMHDDTLNQLIDEQKVDFIKRLRKRNVAHRDIAYMLNMYGANYKLYQAFCSKHSIALTDVTTVETK